MWRGSPGSFRICGVCSLRFGIAALPSVPSWILWALDVEFLPSTFFFFLALRAYPPFHVTLEFVGFVDGNEHHLRVQTGAWEYVSLQPAQVCGQNVMGTAENQCLV